MVQLQGVGNEAGNPQEAGRLQEEGRLQEVGQEVLRRHNQRMY